MKLFNLFLFIYCLCLSQLFAQTNPIQVISPDTKLVIKLWLSEPEKTLSYKISYSNKPVVLQSGLGLKLNTNGWNNWNSGIVLKNVLNVQVNDIKELSSENDFDSYFEIPTQKAVLSFSYKADAVPNNGIVQLEFEDQDNLDAEYQRIIGYGAKIKENSKRNFEFKFYDPDGNLINYYHYCPGFYNQIPPNPN